MMSFDELNAIIERIASGRQTATDVEALRVALINYNHNLLQLGKYNVNIGTGKNIHIGDCIYFEWNEEAIYKLVEVIQAQSNSISRDRFQKILLTEVKKEVELRLNRSLHKGCYIVLDKCEDPHQVNPPWAIDVKTGRNSPVNLPSLTTVYEIFTREEVQGKLLILGSPGSGKTTELLKLAETLIKQAEEDTKKAIPVLLDLSAWRENNQSIKNWIIDQLQKNKRYKKKIPKNVARQLVDEYKIIPLLDGLDELATDRQGLCIQKTMIFWKKICRILWSFVAVLKNTKITKHP